jgi:hypothetical protein
MSCLAKRGSVYSFRRVVPDDLKPILGKSEIMKFLRTKDREQAIDPFCRVDMRGYSVDMRGYSKSNMSSSLGDAYIRFMPGKWSNLLCYRANIGFNMFGRCDGFMMPSRFFPVPWRRHLVRKCSGHGP